MSGLNRIIPYVDGVPLDHAPLLAAIPRTILCICGVVVREHPGGHRDDASTGEPHVHQPPPQPEPLLQIEGPKPRALPDRTGEMPR